MIYLFNKKQYGHINEEYKSQVQFFLGFLIFNFLALLVRCLTHMESSYYDTFIDIAFIMSQTLFSITILVWNWNESTAKRPSLNGVILLHMMSFPIMPIVMAYTEGLQGM